MLLTVEQTLLALEAGDPVPPRAARLAVAVLRHAYAELACGVEKAIGECGTDEWAMARLGGYLYESEVMLSDPVAMYSPAANILPALLACRASAREKSSEGTA